MRRRTVCDKRVGCETAAAALSVAVLSLLPCSATVEMDAARVCAAAAVIPVSDSDRRADKSSDGLRYECEAGGRCVVDADSADTVSTLLLRE